jgi:hypothetical protein
VSGRRPRRHDFDANGRRRLLDLDFDGRAAVTGRNEIGGLANGFAVAFATFASPALFLITFWST